MIYSDLPEGDD
jgi:hypothetical protein